LRLASRRRYAAGTPLKGVLGTGKRDLLGVRPHLSPWAERRLAADTGRASISH